MTAQGHCVPEMEPVHAAFSGNLDEDPRVRRLLVALHAAMAAVAGKTPARSG